MIWPFIPIPLKKRGEDQLYQAQIDLLHAEAHLEQVQSQVNYLSARVIRLELFLRDQRYPKTEEPPATGLVGRLSP